MTSVRSMALCIMFLLKYSSTLIPLFTQITHLCSMGHNYHITASGKPYCQDQTESGVPLCAYVASYTNSQQRIYHNALYSSVYLLESPCRVWHFLKTGAV